MNPKHIISFTLDTQVIPGTKLRHDLMLGSAGIFHDKLIVLFWLKTGEQWTGEVSIMSTSLFHMIS